MEMAESVYEYIEAHLQESLELLIELAQIPAPSGSEEKRTEFCRAWMQNAGCEGVYIDDALNVIWPLGCEEGKPIVVYMAHSDVVFPDTDPLPLRIEDGKIFCPGVGDDTACVAALLTVAKYVAVNRLMPREYGVMFVVNSGEEGLGNLKGTRKIIGDFGDSIAEFITFDSHNGSGVARAVGSKRYKIEFDTEGGHSFSNFGNRNAIAYLASMISALYDMKVPPKGRTTYNVGTISGGTSVNTIAQHAEMLYEFRSDEAESLAVMEKHLESCVEFYRAKGISVTVTKVGDRPCSGDVPADRQAALMARACASSLRQIGKSIEFGAGSTDCNIPLSAGIPAICVGCYEGKGAHTREEYVEIDSLLPGLKFIFDLILGDF